MRDESEAGPGRLLADLPFLSPSEWRIFLVLSIRSPLSVKELLAELCRCDAGFRQGISTLSTLLQRLIANGYVERTMDRRTIVYRPTVAMEPALRRHAERFLTSFTQGRREQLEILLDLITSHLS